MKFPTSPTPGGTAALQAALACLALCAAASYATTSPVPFINQPLVPDAVAPSGAGFTLTVNGTGFVSGSTVYWNGSPRTTTFVSGAQLTAQILASDVAAAGTAAVTVTSPAGEPSLPAFFSITTEGSNLAWLPSSGHTQFPSFSIGAGDFNGDGKPDLAVGDSIQLNKGDGTFDDFASIRCGSGGEVGSITVADPNGDGKADLAFAFLDGSTVCVALGNGDGTFQPGVAYTVGGNTGNVVAADVNGDGKLDLLAPNGGNTVPILLGNGDGTFQLDPNSPPAPHILTVAVGDFNGDGNLDLAGTTATQNVSVLLGNGDGTFQTHKQYYAGPGGHLGLVTADFNGDGKLDLAVSDETASSVSILLGNGDGTFQPEVQYGAGPGPTGIVAADFNGDGKLDLALADMGSNDIAVLLGNGDGTFQKQTHFAAGTEPAVLAAGDFNGDGRIDLAAANWDQITFTVALQAPNPVASLSATSLTFPTQVVGTNSAAQSVTLTNLGAQTLAITNVAITGSNPKDFLESNNCGGSLVSQKSCVIHVSFRPSARGNRSASVSITDNAADSPQTVSLSGVGTVVKLAPTSLNFGSVPVGQTSAPQTVTLTNTSTSTLSVTSISILASEFAQTNNCGSSVPAGAGCSVSVTFTPALQGQRGGTLSISDGGGGSPQTVALSGNGT